MPGLGTIFGSDQERQIISYDYFDTANGTGYDIYFGAKGDNGEYIATTRSLPSEEMATFLVDQTVTNGFVKYLDLDFDIIFNLPRNIKGDVLSSVPMGLCAVDNAAQPFEFYVIVKAVHYDGSTETTIGTGQSVTTSMTGLGNELEQDGISFVARTHLVKSNISSVKHFKKGEILRITVEAWVKSDGANDVHIIMGHDPENRTFSTTGIEEPVDNSAPAGEIRLANEPSSGGGTVTDISTKMEFHVPFVIDL